MSNVRVSPSGRRSIELTEDEQIHILGALAETMEEGNQPYDRKQLELICRLHRRLVRAFGFEQDYRLQHGKVVCARNTRLVVASPVAGGARAIRF